MAQSSSSNKTSEDTWSYTRAEEKTRTLHFVMVGELSYPRREVRLAVLRVPYIPAHLPESASAVSARAGYEQGDGESV